MSYLIKYRSPLLHSTYVPSERHTLSMVMLKNDGCMGSLALYILTNGD